MIIYNDYLYYVSNELILYLLYNYKGKITIIIKILESNFFILLIFRM